MKKVLFIFGTEEQKVLKDFSKADIDEYDETVSSKKV